MSHIVKLKTQTQIDNEAAVWTWRLDSGTLGAAELAEFESWLREDVRNRRTFDELKSAWSALDRLSEHVRPDESIVAVARSERRRRFLRAPRAYWEAAAAAVLVLCIGAAIWTARGPGMQVMSTAIGQQRQMTLADGSKLTLNTNTLLAVKLTSQRRDIYLRRGEAHFDVVHDASRPFFVHAGDAVIRDVGTQFEVRLNSDRDINVLVDEGEVQVQGVTASSAPADLGGSARGENADWVRALTAGQQLHIAGPHVQVASVSPGQIADDLAWRDGALVFKGEPLSQALAEVGRYTRVRIVLTGPTVGSLPISGRFKTDDVTGFFQALQAALPVRVSRPEPGRVDIAPR
ncbi:MAG TPA: FecR domain-containing protein [Steroidobacteraceae bacterium]|jgi:transmembrane sensor